MKALYFIRWLFDWNRWYAFQKRYTIYAVLGISVALFTGINELFWTPAILVWLDFTYEILKDKWTAFKKEQDEMFDNIKGK